MTREEYIEHREALLTDPDIYYSSRVMDTVEHPEFKALVDGGQSILPFLLEDLKHGEGLSYRTATDKPRVWWGSFEAVRLIVGDAPEVPEESRGKLHALTDIYAVWLEKRL